MFGCKDRTSSRWYKGTGVYRDVTLKIKLFVRRTTLESNNKDLAYIECTVLDKEGNIEGEATLIGVGNVGIILVTILSS